MPGRISHVRFLAALAGRGRSPAENLRKVWAVTLPRLFQLLASTPARLFGLPGGKLAKGAPADLCLFHPDRIWQVEAGKLPGKAQNSPFDGRALEGRVLGTWKAGKRVFG